MASKYSSIGKSGVLIGPELVGNAALVAGCGND